MLDLIVPVIVSASLANLSRYVFTDLVKDGSSPQKLILYTLTITNVLLWTDMAIRRYIGKR